MSDWKTVRELALALPEVEEDVSGRTTYRVRGKLFAWMARERDGGGLAVRVDRDEKQLILDSNPEVVLHEPALQRVSGRSDPARGDRACGAPGAARGRLADPGSEATRRRALRRAVASSSSRGGLFRARGSRRSPSWPAA